MPASGIGVSGSTAGLAPDAPPVFEDHVSANTVQKRAQFIGIADYFALLGAKKADQGLLDEIIDIGAIMTDVIQHLVPEFQNAGVQWRVRSGP